MLVVMLLGSAAHAEDDVFVFAAGHAGLNLPLGGLGGELGVGLDWLRASGSVGRGFRGVSMAAMVRAVREVSGVDVGVGIGVSRGPGLHDLNISLGEGGDDPEFNTHYGQATRWLDAEVSAELAVSDHGFVRFTLGMTRAFDIDCDSERYGTHEPSVCDGAQIAELRDDGFVPYLGIAGGLRYPEAPSSKPRYQPLPQPSYQIPVMSPSW